MFLHGQIMNAETQAENRNSHEALQATLKNGQEKNRKPTLPAAFSILETGSIKERQATRNDFPDRDHLKSYTHLMNILLSNLP